MSLEERVAGLLASVELRARWQPSMKASCGAGKVARQFELRVLRALALTSVAALSCGMSTSMSAFRRVAVTDGVETRV